LVPVAMREYLEADTLTTTFPRVRTTGVALRRGVANEKEEGVLEVKPRRDTACCAKDDMSCGGSDV